ncbi:RidA family protein [Pseudomaricurvus alkylphenolicus]|nr:RidA family protein [Pseudomaricurvus alkylphenolicus]
MTSSIEKKLMGLGLSLPQSNDPVANYTPFSKDADVVYISGQTCKWNGVLKYTGYVGEDITVDQGKKAAELCMLNLLLQLKTACNGNLDDVISCLKLTVYVNAKESFASHPNVADGASNLLLNVMGDKGIHARAAVGSSSLPGNASVEIDGIFKIEG